MIKIKDKSSYEIAYQALNSAQKQAVDTIEGPVMVIAGPGTGKTQILTLRIANILRQTQMGPNNILALTFTDAGAKAMRERLHRYIGAEAYQVAIYTFHGFAERLIRDYPDAYTRVIGGRPASDLDKITLVETILEDTNFKLLRPIGNPIYYVKPILGIIGSLKKEYVTPDIFAGLIAEQERDLMEVEQFHSKGAHKGKVRGEYTKKEKALLKNRELLMMYRQYEALLSERRLYDFEDMIVETVKALEGNEDMLRDLQETYQYILADEHQDVNGSQNRILELLCNFHDQPNIFVVGDEKQAIYRFQGASLENFLYFTDLFQGVKQINLTDNYRSGQDILDAAHSLIKVESGPLMDLRVPLVAKSVSSSLIERRDFSHQAVEDTWVVSEVNNLIKTGVPEEEITIILRTNREVEQFTALLRKEGILAEASSDGDILYHPIMNGVQSFIEAVVSSHNEKALFTLMHGAYWGISTNDLIKIASARSYGTSLWSIISEKDKLKSLKVEGIDNVINIVSTLEEARKMAVSESPHRILEKLLAKSGFLEHVIASDALEGSRVVRRIYDEIEKMVLYDKRSTLKEVNDVLVSYKEHGISLKSPYITTDQKSVRVMTAHKSKGLEFEVVFVPHASDNVWGGSSKKRLFDIPLKSHVKDLEEDVIDDERRLLYVAMTRAKTKMYLSYSGQSTEGKELVASRLFDSIDQSIKIRETDEFEAGFDPIHSLQKNQRTSLVDVDLLRTLLKERGLSVTALNNYLQNPYNYLYRNVLKIPEVQPLPMQFGTVIHGVMEWIIGSVSSTREVPQVNEIKARLETELSRLPLTETEFTRLHEKGLEALLAYTGKVSDQLLTVDSRAEFSIEVTLATGIPDFPEVTLNGKLDRLDFDKEGRVTRVVDYKTGKSKTRNEIEGKTKDSNGDYKRQLTFYALLLSLYEDQKFACREGQLSFVEPDAKGVIHEELFSITDEEIEDLKVTIINVVRDIISGDFLKTECDSKTGDYCHLASMLAS